MSDSSSSSDMEFRVVDPIFQESYKTYPVAMLPEYEHQVEMEQGGKIVMPQSALVILMRLTINYPMMFKLTNHLKERSTHAGVLEFSAEEGKCYMPEWMMRNLHLADGELIEIENVSLPAATFAKFQPQSTDFLDVANPKAVLEYTLRNFACLTVGDVIAIKYNKKVYELSVLETQPGNAVGIITCDMIVDFEAPVGYEPDKPASEQPAERTTDHHAEETETTFPGTGRRVDGKPIKKHQQKSLVTRQSRHRGIPEYEYEVGNLTFDRSVRPNNTRESEQSDDVADPNSFTGEGHTFQ